MKLLAFTEDARGAAARYRVVQFLPALEAAGVEAEVEAVPRERRRRADLFERAGDADVVLVQRRLLTPWDAARLRRRARRLVFDFDDALPFKDSRRGAGPSLGRGAKFRALVRCSDLVLAGNAYLADLAAPFASRVVVVPTAVPTDRFRPAPPADPAILGWIGSRSTLPYLEDVLPALEALEGFRLRVVSDAFPKRSPLPIDSVPWSEADEPSQISRFGIGLAPLPDDRWTRGKCGLRVLLYFAAGVPVIASPVGVQADLVDDGVTGMIAADACGFAEAARRLREDEALRRAVAAAGRARVEARYSLERVAPVLVDALRSVM